MSKVLNDAQRKLVEDNHNLIYSFLNSRHLSLDSVEDWYGTAAIGLCKAALTYDESRGTNFSTYAYKCIQNEVGNVMRANANRIVPDFSLDDTVIENGYIGEIIADEKDPFFDIYVKESIEIATRGMSDRDTQMVDMIVRQGYDQASVARKFGLTRQRVSEITKPALEKVRDYFRD